MIICIASAYPHYRQLAGYAIASGDSKGSINDLSGYAWCAVPTSRSLYMGTNLKEAKRHVEILEFLFEAVGRAD